MILRRSFLAQRPFLRTMATSPPKVIHFGPYEVTDQVGLSSTVFYNTPLCYCLVNIKPILPGHVLVIPYRPVPRLTDLTPAEVFDLFSTVQKVQKMLAMNYFKHGDEVGKLEDGSFNVALQDGPEAGQTVAHVHCHIIPRSKDTSGEGDGIYDRLQGEEGNVGGGLWDTKRPIPIGKFPKIEDADRKPRDPEVMNREAAFFREQMKSVELGEFFRNVARSPF
ncbi:HIT-like protein [Mollisia scopiformis]|uniref:Bis(5'-adenosyl)-triphosphatase n=1 Tax=Mollisia scopiformis TaxID=149040 RepID=A0A194X9H9_MOLSC|nr:HIT-like protein [Mollisia scopiformis]KUJ16821.1 HIT-like protein [Mollisia scopiformis]